MNDLILIVLVCAKPLIVVAIVGAAYFYWTRDNAQFQREFQEYLKRKKADKPPDPDT